VLSLMSLNDFNYLMVETGILDNDFTVKELKMVLIQVCGVECAGVCVF